MHGCNEDDKQMFDTEQMISGCQFCVVTHFSTPFLFIFRTILTEKEVKGN